MNDPRAIVDDNPMSSFQWTIILVMGALNALDGFDVLSVSYASPGIASEWGISRAGLGVVLSMELIGMAFGSVLLGNVADRAGRRKTILGCLTTMAAGMLAASQADGVTYLSVCRVVTGLGIGGMLAAINGATAEAANRKNRTLCITLMASGYPIGSVVGGSISAELLQLYDWRAIFLFGAFVTVCLIPLVMWRVPESVAFTIQRGGADALDKVNHTLRRMGHRTVDALPGKEDHAAVPLAELFAPAHRRRSILLAATYFAHVLTFYFLIKWIPKIVVDMGFAPSSAAEILVAASAGGALGSILLGLLSIRIRVFSLTLVCMAASTIMVILFGYGHPTFASLWMICFAAGFFTNAAIAGVYTIVAQNFPTHLRTSATGFVVGIGRGGSALAPALAGILFEQGYALLAVAIIMGLGSTIAGLTLFSLRRRMI